MTTGFTGSPYGPSWRAWTGKDGRLDTKGELKVNPFTLERAYFGSNPKFPYVDLNHWRVDFDTFRSEHRSLYVAMQNSLVTHVYGEIDKVNYLASLYEAKSSLATVTDYATRTLKAIGKLSKLPRTAVLAFAGIAKPRRKPRSTRGRGHRVNRRSKKDYSKVPSEWLQYHFGLAPLIGDISAIANVFDQPLEPTLIKGFLQETFTRRRFSAGRYWELDCQVRLSYSVKIRVKNPNVGIIESAGLTNLIGTIWEVMPWSWAVDYFINVGDMLSNFQPRFADIEFIAPNHTWTITSMGEMETNFMEPRLPSWAWYLTMQRFASIPLAHKLISEIAVTTQRLSYLCSAFALTLKGKLK